MFSGKNKCFNHKDFLALAKCLDKEILLGYRKLKFDIKTVKIINTTWNGKEKKP